MKISKLDFKFFYRASGFERVIDGVVNDNAEVVNENNDLDLIYEVEDKDGYDILTVKVKPKKAINIVKFIINVDKLYSDSDRIFCNGYQSWTDSKECMISEKHHSISFFSKLIERAVHFKPVGDYGFVSYSKKAGDLHSHTYSYIRNGENFMFVGSLSERTGYTVIKHKAQSSRFFIKKLYDNIRINEEYVLASIMIMKDTDCDKIFDTYFKEMGIEKPRKKFANGYTTWYNHYQNINSKIVYENIDALKKNDYNVDIFQIDDGYQTAIGDWLDVDKNKFPEGLKTIADFIKSKNMTPGLWLAPFACTKSSNIYKNHKDWLVSDKHGKPLSAGANWGGFYTLDIYNPAAREYIINVFDVVLNQWGFELVKLDFLYQAASYPRNNKSRGQLMCEAMDFLRECVGEKLILGCGVPLAPAFGKVDFCRIGADVSLNWLGSNEKVCHREGVSTRNAIMNSIYRRHLDGRAFVNDTDVFLLRDDNIKMNEEQKNLLAYVNNLTGNLLFTSDNVDDYDDNKHQVFKKTYLKSDATVVDVTNSAPFLVEMKCVDKNGEFLVNIDVQNGLFINK